MHLNSALLFKKYALSFFNDYSKVLEIGPAGIPSAYKKIVNNPSVEWHTIDFGSTTYIDSLTDNLTYKLINSYDFPIEDESYDIIVSGQVIEHVEKIWVWLNELKRILKKDGLIITINPVSWPYHEAPVDCWRIFPVGIKALAEEVNLNVEFCITESLEKDQIYTLDAKSKFIPGKSYNYDKPTSSIGIITKWNRIIRKVPFVSRYLEIPIEVAFDTFSVLKKT